MAHGNVQYSGVMFDGMRGGWFERQLLIDNFSIDVPQAAAAKCMVNMQIALPVSIRMISSSIQRKEIAVTEKNIIQGFEALQKNTCEQARDLR